MNEESLARLERLAKLKESGAITAEEFEQQKAALLGNSAPLIASNPAPPAPLVSTTAPTSATPKPKKTNGLWVLLAIVLIVVILYKAANTSADSSASLPADSLGITTLEQDNATSDSTAVASTPAPPTNWSYYDDSDKMGSKYYTASVDANEQLQFNFPYNGGSTATLTMRRKGGSTDLYLRVSKGQFITHVGDEGTARIKFDDGKPVAYSISGAADYSSDIIFFDSAKTLIAKMKKAKKMIIEVEFYSEGNRQIEFNVASLKWNH